MSTGKIIAGIAAGIAAGTVLGILFAPDKGTDTRKKIAQKVTDFSDGFKSKVKSLLAEVEDEYNNAKDVAHEVMEDGKEKASDLVKKGKEQYNEWKSDAKQQIPA